MNKKERFYKLLNDNKFVFLDGGLGTMLQKSGLKTGEVPELMNLEHPEIVAGIHKAYAKAGSQIIYANTFGANSYKMAETGKTVEELISAAIRIAKGAVGEDVLIALDIGPVGQLLEPTGTLKFEEAYDYFKEEILAGKDADLIAIETMTDLYEMKAALLAAKENSDLPVVCTMTFEQNLRTFTGCSVGAMALTLEGLGADAIGVNCSLGPREFEPIIEELAKWTKLPIVAKPNAGLPNPVTNEYDVTPEEFAESAANLVKHGIKLTGGCCGTDPDYIRALIARLSKMEYVPNTPKSVTAVCSAERVVVIDQPRIIGERINPTGKKLFKEALRKGDIDYIMGQAIEQSHAGAEILDVNVGLPEIDEKAMMVRTVKALQGITDLPLQIDSTIPEVLEAALRVYNGKPIVNSVNGESGSLKKILPIVKKYGAAVVGLTLDEDGIPKTTEKRFEIAERIMNSAIEMGIPREDIFIDCLTLTASAEQENVMKTVEAVHRVKTELGLKTVLGVSNISFGLPNRELINCNFLQMCLVNGLDLPIMNPNVASMTGAVRAYRLLTNIDVNSVDFIKAYGAEKTPPTPLPKLPEGANHDLMYAVSNGLKSEGAKITEELLETTDSMQIVDDILIPALDKIGDDFEKGKIFLPQLIMSAGVAQAAFEVIRSHMVKNNSAPVVKGKVVLATVKGDIHDIGKNIVKVLLENYGYEVIDLGRDVDYQAVVDAAIEHKVKLVGLSALMTTTLGSMEKTIQLLRENRVDCKVVVGGAVLTPEYAESIGADFYAKDAKETVDVAKRIYG
ncbi:MAG: homocysteine S-methyltransferase family protein [Oscillospiraceae bacterium]|nr:homocysteine S-methyltransferase family protein [Oscillospiraceae bacterium]